MIKILLVLGDQKGIKPEITKNDILVSRSLGARRLLIEVTDIENPTPDQFKESFKSKSFDILIIVGHTDRNDDGNDGIITINNGQHKDKDNNDIPKCISMSQYKGIFKESVANRLKLVILAGCCSDGAARQLTMEMGVPKVIAFRMPIAPSVVRVFFEELFRSWIKNSLNLQLAINTTREHLQINNQDSPGASGTPILLTSTNAEEDLPLMFSGIARSSLRGRLLDPLLSIPLISTLLDRLIRLKYLRYLALFIVASVLAWVLWMIRNPYPITACDEIRNTVGNLATNISCGNKDLLGYEHLSNGDKDILGYKKLSSDSKKIYKEAMAELEKNSPDYDKVNKLVDLINNNPEISIAYYNARIKQNLQNKGIESIETMVVMLPLSDYMKDEEKSLPISILTAVAQAQSQWNSDPSHRWGLEVILVNDLNDENNIKSKESVAFINKLQGIIGAVSHYNSALTKAFAFSYKENKLILVSGTNTATGLKNIIPNYIRIPTTTDDQAKNIMDFVKKQGIKKIAIFSEETKNGVFAKSFKESVIKAGKEHQIEIIESDQFSLNSSMISEDAAKQIVKNEYGAVIVNPNSFTNASIPGKIVDLLGSISAQSPSCLIIGNEVVADSLLINSMKNKKIKTDRLFISLPWSETTIKTLPNWSETTIKTLPKRHFDAENLGDIPIRHRAFLTYDAVYVLLDVIQFGKTQKLDDAGIKNQFPQLVEKITKNNNYVGMTGLMTFKGSERNGSLYGLVKPEVDKNGNFKRFVKA